MRPIDADALKLGLRLNNKGLEHVLHSLIDSLPTLELAPVVRCQKCMFWEEKEGYFPICKIRSERDFRPHKDGFCDMGKRKEQK